MKPPVSRVEDSAPSLGGDLGRLADAARRIRLHVIRMAAVKRVHVGPALSIVEILTLLLCLPFLKRQGSLDDPRRDRFILSKGHGALALYGALCEAGLLPAAVLAGFGQPGNPLAGHPVCGIPGVEVPTGSLGHGLAIGCGLALAARMDDLAFKTVVLLGDGELGEGSVWEAAAFAAHQRLGGLVAIVDCNGCQQEGPTREILNMEPLEAKWRAFGWQACRVDGHGLPALSEALSAAWERRDVPSVLIAETVKGKGIPFMENDPGFHMSWLQGELLDRALAALEVDGDVAG